MPTPIAFELSVTWADWRSIVFAHSPGQAKATYLRDIRDSWPDTKFTDIRCRRASGRGNAEPYDSPARFKRVAEYRGVPHWKIGDRVRAAKEYVGHLIDGDSSCNFVILLDNGSQIHAHVSEIENQSACDAAMGVQP